MNREDAEPETIDTLKAALARAEVALAETQRAERTAEAGLRLYSDIVENMAIGLYVWRLDDSKDNRSLRLIAVNRAGSRIVGRNSEDMLGKTLGELFPAMLSTRVPEVFADVVRAQAAVELGEMRHRDRQRIESFFLVSAFPLLNQCLGVTYEDITERKAVERMKDEFVSTVSHELRTPLTSIRGALGLLEGNILGNLPEEAMEVVQIARTNADRLIRLINEILDLEKMEAGKLKLKLGAVRADKLVSSTIGGLRAVADAARVEIRAEVRVEGVFIADEDRLIQVLTNLLSNAIQFSPAGGKISLRVEPAEDPERIRFSIKDQGPGIDGPLIPKLFRKFQQLDASDARKQSGSGLGLAISKAIVEQHGGIVGVESQLGQGSTFWFEIPESPPASDTEITVDERLALQILGGKDSILGAKDSKGLG